MKHECSRPYFIKVKTILSLNFNIILIFPFIKECKNGLLEFSYGIEDKIIKVKKNWKFTRGKDKKEKLKIQEESTQIQVKQFILSHLRWS